ncbi:hypothetical protein Lal_00037994 [Lupinus albus]|nr:hypothetical protein Lal_00037994 [Lupinus albus]
MTKTQNKASSQTLIGAVPALFPLRNEGEAVRSSPSSHLRTFLSCFSFLLSSHPQFHSAPKCQRKNLTPLPPSLILFHMGYNPSRLWFESTLTSLKMGRSKVTARVDSDFSEMGRSKVTVRIDSDFSENGKKFLGKGYCYEKRSEERARVELQVVDVSFLAELVPKIPKEVSKELAKEYGRLSDLLVITIGAEALKAIKSMIQFWNTTLHVFEFPNVDASPTIEEYEVLLDIGLSSRLKLFSTLRIRRHRGFDREVNWGSPWAKPHSQARSSLWAAIDVFAKFKRFRVNPVPAVLAETLVSFRDVTKMAATKSDVAYIALLWMITRFIHHQYPDWSRYPLRRFCTIGVKPLQLSDWEKLFREPCTWSTQVGNDAHISRIATGSMIWYKDGEASKEALVSIRNALRKIRLYGKEELGEHKLTILTRHQGGREPCMGHYERISDSPEKALKREDQLKAIVKKWKGLIIRHGSMQTKINLSFRAVESPRSYLEELVAKQQEWSHNWDNMLQECKWDKDRWEDRCIKIIDGLGDFADNWLRTFEEARGELQMHPETELHPAMRTFYEHVKGWLGTEEMESCRI